MKFKNRKGFTLVELLVVIAIIGILAVVAVPSLFKNIDRAKISEFKGDINAFKFTINAFYTDHNRMPENDKEWSEAVKANIDAKFEIVDNKVSFESPFNRKYNFNFINKVGDKTVPVYRIDIGGFAVSKNIVELIRKDEFFINENVSITENGTVWFLIDIPK